jgi:hypothetical protein
MVNLRTLLLLALRGQDPNMGIGVDALRLRMERLLPADLQSRLPEFTLDQLVALRFASDDELPALARRVLDERPRDRKAIKKMIRTWRPDFLRA